MNKPVKLIVAGVILITAGVFAMRAVGPGDPLGLDNPYKVDVITPPKPSPSSRIVNRSTLALRVRVFDAADVQKSAPRATWTLAPGDSLMYPRATYVFDIWQAGSGGAHLAWSGPRWGNVVFTGDAGHLDVVGESRRPVTIVNDADEPLAFCVYSTTVPMTGTELRPCWQLAPASHVAWADAPPTFQFKVFLPARPDTPLLSRSEVRDDAFIRLYKQDAGTNLEALLFRLMGK